MGFVHDAVSALAAAAPAEPPSSEELLESICYDAVPGTPRGAAG